MRALSARWLAWTTVGGIVFGMGCQTILDTKDRTLDPALVNGSEDPAAPAGTSPICTDYCASVLSNCQGPYAQYVSTSVCLAACARLTLGPADATFGNTVRCRKTEADLAGNTGEPAEHCPSAGPAGNGQCGTTCDSYCTLMTSICPTSFSGPDECKFDCSSMTDLMTYDISQQRGDTLQCRIFHVCAATQNAASHCPHAGAMPTRYCVDQGDAEPPPEAGAACDLADGANACDTCQAQSCCPEKNDCYADAICDTADSDLDRCVDIAQKTDAGTASCYDSFTTTGPAATALLDCKRLHCAAACSVP